MDWQDESREQSGTGGAKPRTLAVLLAILVIAAAGAFAILADGKQRPPKDFTGELEFDAPEVDSADAKTKDGKKRLQVLVTNPDPAIANQAAFKLALQGDEGWLALYNVLPRASQATIEYVQTVSLGEGRESAAAKAFESGSDSSREGAYLALKNYVMEASISYETGQPIRRDDGPRIFYALLPRIAVADKLEQERLFALFKRYMPTAQTMNFARHESPLLRAAAASRFGFGNEPEEEAVLKELANDTDPLVQKEAKNRLKSRQITKELEAKRLADGSPHALDNP